MNAIANNLALVLGRYHTILPDGNNASFPGAKGSAEIIN